MKKMLLKSKERLNIVYGEMALLKEEYFCLREPLLNKNDKENLFGLDLIFDELPGILLSIDLMIGRLEDFEREIK